MQKELDDFYYTFEDAVQKGYYELVKQNEDKVKYSKHINIDEEKCLLFYITRTFKDPKHQFFIQFPNHLYEKMLNYVKKTPRYHIMIDKIETAYILLENIINTDFERAVALHNGELEYNPIRIVRYPSEKFNMASVFKIKKDISEYKTRVFSNYQNIKCSKCNNKDAIQSHIISKFILENLQLQEERSLYKIYPFDIFDCHIQKNINNLEDIFISTHPTASLQTTARLYCDSCDKTDFENEANFFTEESKNNRIINSLNDRYIDYLKHRYLISNKNYNSVKNNLSAVKNKEIIEIIKNNKNTKELVNKETKNNLNFYMEIDFQAPYSYQGIVPSNLFNSLFNFYTGSQEEEEEEEEEDNKPERLRYFRNLKYKAESYCIINFLRKEKSSILTLSFKNLDFFTTKELEKNIENILINFNNYNEELLFFIENHFYLALKSDSEFFLSANFFNKLSNNDKTGLLTLFNKYRGKKNKNILIQDPYNNLNYENHCLKILHGFFRIEFQNVFYDDKKCLMKKYKVYK